MHARAALLARFDGLGLFGASVLPGRKDLPENKNLKKGVGLDRSTALVSFGGAAGYERHVIRTAIDGPI